MSQLPISVDIIMVIESITLLLSRHYVPVAMSRYRLHHSTQGPPDSTLIRLTTLEQRRYIVLPFFLIYFRHWFVFFFFQWNRFLFFSVSFRLPFENNLNAISNSVCNKILALKLSFAKSDLQQNEMSKKLDHFLGMAMKLLPL